MSAFPLDSRFGLDRGFDVYDDRFADVDTPHGVPRWRSGPGRKRWRSPRDWIRRQGDGPWFCWVHLYEPHFPYAPPEPLRSRFASAPYHGEVAAADAALGPLLEPILAAGPSGRTLVVLTADHGESLGEHGELTHGIFAYEATLRVPLVLYAPRLLRPRVVARARAPRGHPADRARRARPLRRLRASPGRSLLAARGRASPCRRRESYLEALSSARNRGWAPLYGVVHGAVQVRRPAAARAVRPRRRSRRDAEPRGPCSRSGSRRCAAALARVREGRSRMGRRGRGRGGARAPARASATWRRRAPCGAAPLHRRRRPQAAHRPRRRAAGPDRAVPGRGSRRRPRPRRAARGGAPLDAARPGCSSASCSARRGDLRARSEPQEGPRPRSRGLGHGRAARGLPHRGAVALRRPLAVLERLRGASATPTSTSLIAHGVALAAVGRGRDAEAAFVARAEARPHERAAPA